MKALHYAPNKKNLTILFLAAFAIRLAVFLFFIYPNECYKQPDSGDYHHCALSLTLGRGMHRLDNNRPMFWRTPGYPLFLSCFYKIFGIKSTDFSKNRPAQTAALIFQMLLCSLIPLLIFFLALLLTKSLSISWITAWISAIHVGFVLADTYILTESLSILFLIPFFIFFFKSFYLPGQISPPNNKLLRNLIMAGICLGAFAWIRPMGHFVSIASAIMILILDSVNWKMKLKKIVIFLLVFFAIISPWYVRNYNITGKLFFCPMFGLYLNTFNAPKIIRATEGLPLRESINKLYQQANKMAVQDFLIARASGKDLATELVHLKVALPIVMKHPFLFLKDWLTESCKTTFDLYSYQLVDIAKGTFYYDPPEEFLTEKWAECIYEKKVSPLMRFVIYLEIIFELLKWIGLLLGVFIFWLFPLIKRLNVSDYIKQTGLLWLKVAPMIGAFIIMTGGFGYARLRLPVEALMVILSLTTWYWLIKKENL